MLLFSLIQQNPYVACCDLEKMCPACPNFCCGEEGQGRHKSLTSLSTRSLYIRTRPMIVPSVIVAAPFAITCV